MTFLDANIRSWGRSAVQHLGWEVGGDECRPNKGNGGCASMYECARYGGKEVMSLLQALLETDHAIQLASRRQALGCLARACAYRGSSIIQSEYWPSE